MLLLEGCAAAGCENSGSQQLSVWFLFCSNILCLTSIYSQFSSMTKSLQESMLWSMLLYYVQRWHICQAQLLSKKMGGKPLPVIITGKSQQVITCSAVSHRAQMQTTLSMNPAVKTAWNNLNKSATTPQPINRSVSINYSTHFCETLQSDVDPLSCVFPVNVPQHEHTSGT